MFGQHQETISRIRYTRWGDGTIIWQNLFHCSLYVTNCFKISRLITRPKKDRECFQLPSSDLTSNIYLTFAKHGSRSNNHWQYTCKQKELPKKVMFAITTYLLTSLLPYILMLTPPPWSTPMMVHHCYKVYGWNFIKIYKDQERVGVSIS